MFETINEENSGFILIFTTKIIYIVHIIYIINIIGNQNMFANVATSGFEGGTLAR